MLIKSGRLRRRFGIILITFVSLIMGAGCMEQMPPVPRMSFDELQPLLHKTNDTVYVINFWATWCKPCIRELPYFEKINTEFSNSKVKVVLVSIDIPADHEKVLLPYVRNNRIRSDVIHLTDTDANEWIDKVSPQWSGSIPATLVYKGEWGDFYEKSFTYEELKKIVESKI